MNEDSLPIARVRKRRSWSWLWLIPVLALGVASWLMLSALGQRGIPISIELQDGHGLKPGDALRYRGISVGKVRNVSLADDLGAIRVEVVLDRSADELARAGSRFWVVRPQVDISGASGLKTLIGANFLGVLPGQGEFQDRFVGLEAPPLLALMEAGGLEIMLVTRGKGNLRAGAPISYRQVVVGKILSVDLTKDAGAVAARAYIEPRYTSLIRERTRFWKVSGARWHAGLSGISLDVESLGGLVLGGVTLAIPPDPGPPVPQSHRFELYDEPQTDWLEWVPFLSLGAADEGLTQDRPRPVQAVLHWRYRNYLYLTRDAQRRGWVLPVAGGVIGPRELLMSPEEALEDSVRLRVGGQEAPLGSARPLGEGLAFLTLAVGLPAWPEDRRRIPDEPEDSLIIADPERPVRFLAAEHIHPGDGGWNIDDRVPFDANWQGAAVVSDHDGTLIGLLLVTGDGARLARLTPAADALPEPEPASSGSWWQDMIGVFSGD